MKPTLPLPVYAGKFNNPAWVLASDFSLALLVIVGTIIVGANSLQDLLYRTTSTLVSVFITMPILNRGFMEYFEKTWAFSHVQTGKICLLDARLKVLIRPLVLLVFAGSTLTWWGDKFLALLGAPKYGLTDHTTISFHIAALVYPFCVLLLLVRAFLHSLRCFRGVLAVLVLVNLINGLLCYWFVFYKEGTAFLIPLKWGGAPRATLSNAISLTIALFMLAALALIQLRKKRAQVLIAHKPTIRVSCEEKQNLEAFRITYASVSKANSFNIENLICLSIELFAVLLHLILVSEQYKEQRLIFPVEELMISAYFLVCSTLGGWRYRFSKMNVGKNESCASPLSQLLLWGAPYIMLSVFLAFGFTQLLSYYIPGLVKVVHGDGVLIVTLGALCFIRWVRDLIVNVMFPNVTLPPWIQILTSLVYALVVVGCTSTLLGYHHTEVKALLFSIFLGELVLLLSRGAAVLLIRLAFNGF